MSGEAADVASSLDPLVSLSESSGLDVDADGDPETEGDAAAEPVDAADDAVEAAFSPPDLPLDDEGACVASAKSRVFGDADAAAAVAVTVEPVPVC